VPAPSQIAIDVKRTALTIRLLPDR
jgi:hypothetical protein